MSTQPSQDALVAEWAEAKPWSGRTPSWARRAAHRAGIIAQRHKNPSSDAAHQEMLIAICEEYENRGRSP